MEKGGAGQKYLIKTAEKLFQYLFVMLELV